ncbi:hypothetical protein BJ875DRAFT_474800 [Amylocarpus encephaloides]|uniref:SnoaL-like domain-containing protein n=1 Tax=Amylocarpus encephaloides TaxID=45428 RepID=A0A9P7Y964_9HELO|nr:hypothetical protein BJ875DRAFT_474800 [Amylocarpus encephaloides]
MNTADQHGQGELRHFLSPITPTLMNMKLWQKEDTEAIVDVEARKVVLQARSRADTPVGEYTNDYIFILTLGEDGKIVDEYWEWLGSDYTKAFIGKMRDVVDKAKN